MSPINFPSIYQPLRGTTETLVLGELVRRMDNGLLNLNPDYQREVVWTDTQASLFMGFLLEGNLTTEIIANRDGSETPLPDEIVDGKQRLTSCLKWLRGEIPATLSDGTTVWFKDASEGERRTLLGIKPYMTIRYVSLNRPDVLRLYLRLNRGGTVHTDTEIERVRSLLSQLT